MRTCEVEGCGSKHLARGYCSRHYQSIHLPEVRDSCSVEGCDRRIKVKVDGVCDTHYARLRVHGSTELPSREDRFWERVDQDPEGCWLIGAPDTYHTATAPDGTVTNAHRVAFIYENGGVPDGLVVDHLCETPGCVNPDHLAATTQRVNVLRSVRTEAGKNVRKTHCKRGHPLSGDNLYRHGRRRHCKTCRREYHQ